MKKIVAFLKKILYNNFRVNDIDARLAQLAEHLTLNQGVQGSNPWSRIKSTGFIATGYGVGAFFV